VVVPVEEPKAEEVVETVEDVKVEEVKEEPKEEVVEVVEEVAETKEDVQVASKGEEFETVEEYRNSIKERLTKEANDRAEIELDNDILDKIIDDTVIEIPDVMVEDEFNRQLKGMENQMRYQGLTMEDYAKYTDKTVDDIKADIKKNATRNVKARLVLDKLIRSEKLDITEADIDNKIAEMAKNVGKDVEEYKKQVNNDMVNHIANELLMKKLLNFLHENNEIK
jgi:trigger factor